MVDYASGVGLAYLFALIVGVGIVSIQIALGGKGHAAHGAAADHAAADKDLAKSGGLGAVVLSTRFWVFACLGFGLSGALLDTLGLAAPSVRLIIALLTGASAGTFAGVAFRIVSRASTTTSIATSDAVGQIGRVLVPCAPGQIGQIRVELRGHSVDITATTDEPEIARGEHVLVESVDAGVARVSRRPSELA